MSKRLIVNKIKEENVGKIYHEDGTYVGRFENVMESLEFRCQVVENKASNYYMIYDKHPDLKVRINENGGVENHPDDLNTPTTYTRRIFNMQLNDTTVK